MELVPQVEEHLNLRRLAPFAIGGRRICFVHPKDPSKCVKVLRTDEGRALRLKSNIITAAIRRSYDNNADELRELKALESRIGRKMAEHFPRAYGIVSTDMGPGLVLDLIRDQDGTISRNIRELIVAGRDLYSLREAFEELGRFLLEHLIVTRALMEHNLVIKEHRHGKSLYLIDGIGDRSWLRPYFHLDWLNRKKIGERLDAAWPRFEQFALNNRVASPAQSPKS